MDMDIPEVKPIQLTPEESDLRKAMEEDFSRHSGYTGKPALSLLKALSARKAIPEARIRIFTDPYPGGRGKSHREAFERYGHRDDAIFEHPNFVKYLRYFMDGPSLPVTTVENFRKILIKDSGTSGMVMDELCRFVRAETRRPNLERGEAREEFWRLAQEAGYFSRRYNSGGGWQCRKIAVRQTKAPESVGAFFCYRLLPRER